MKRLQSGKFWMKLAGTAAIVLAVSAILAYAVKYLLLASLFSPDKLRRAADEAVAGTGRRIRFSERDVSTTVFPRPTVVLQHVELSRPHGAAADIRIEEMRIGVGWASLFGEPVIEKWVLIRPEFSLSRDEAGGWNIGDLLAKQSGTAVDRIIIEDGRLRLDTPSRQHVLEHISLNVNNADDAQTQVKAEGRLKTPLWAEETDWKLNGVLHRSAAGWHMPELLLRGNSRYRDAGLDFRLTADTAWQRQSGDIRFGKARLTVNVPEYNLHLNAESPSVLAAGSGITARAADAVLTMRRDGVQWDATLAAKNITLGKDTAEAGQIDLNGSRKTIETQAAFTLNTPLKWQRQGGWEMPALKLTTRLDNATGNPRPRLVGEFGGSWHYWTGGWQGRLKGRLDRENAEINALYAAADRRSGRPARLTAEASVEKLVLSPYLDNPGDGIPAYPAWLQGKNAPEIEASLTVGTLQAPKLEIRRLTTRLLADRKRIVLPDFRAELYNGVMEGGISMAATSPPTYHLQQYARNINIRPLMQDLFHYGSISGEGDAEIDLTAQGGSRADLARTLSGTLELNLSNGAWLGLNLNQALQNLFGNKTAKTDSQAVTPFSRFTLSSTISKGIGRHEQAELHSDRFRIVLDGSTDFTSMTLNERLQLYPAGGQGKPIPLNIRGKPDNPSVTIDYKRLTSGLDTAEEKQQALARAIREQWQWFNSGKPDTAAPSDAANPPAKP